jgi:Chitobiase/beta-hexosaminidase C-terminal domain/Glycosyl hydrolases family 16
VPFSDLHGSALPTCETNHGRIAPIHSMAKTPLAMIPHSIFVALCVLGSLTFVAQGEDINGEAAYISFSVPGALGIYPMSINNSMEVTGYYNVTATVARGFLREPDGTITTFDVGGALWTEPEGINAAGNITGFYELVAGVPQGFLRYADGRIITFDPPPAQTGTPLEAQPVSISDFDGIAGNFPYPASLPSAFTRSRAGVFTTIQVPYDVWTVATAINASGSVVGYFKGERGYTGFVAHPDGYWAEIAVPGDSRCPEGPFPDGINAAGTVAGWSFNYSYTPNGACTLENTSGFVMSPEGELTLFQSPGTILTLALPGFTVQGFPLTVPHLISIDEAGDIAGSYTDAAGVQHGFVRNPYGTITSFDPPESKQTTATSINDGGAITGFYHYNAGGGPSVGFIRVPLAAPSFSPGPGSYVGAQTVTITAATPSAMIHYTTDGSTPSPSSTLYSGPISLSSSATIGAIAVLGNLSSPVTSGSYVISLTPPPIVVTVTPATASIATAATQQFAASVTGASNTAVTWAVSGAGCSSTSCGTISSSGLYTAPAAVSTSDTVAITAISVADPTKYASATVSLVPPQIAGYNLVWEDTFSTLSLCTTNLPGCNWYDPGVYNLAVGGSVTDPSGTYLNLEWSESITGGNWTNISTMAQDGSNVGRAWNYGYYEVSMLFDPATGSWPAIWMKPEADIGAVQNNGGELDIFEWQSNAPTTFYGTIHNWNMGTDEASNGFNGSNAFPVPAGTNFAQYHTYGVLWTAAAVSWYFDNVLMGSQSITGEYCSTNYSSTQNYYLILSQQNGCKWTFPCTGQVDPLNMQVQWVHVFAPPPGHR